MNEIRSKRWVPLFQYGSNMDPERLNSPCRLDNSAKKPRRARLHGWGVRFDLFSKCNQCAVTDIIPNPREHVLGILYQVPYRKVVAPRGQRSRMDEIEDARHGPKSNYKRIKVKVHIGQEKLEARTYVGTASGKKRFLRKSEEEQQVSKDYFSHLVSGAKKFRFRKSYVASLRKRAGQFRLRQR